MRITGQLKFVSINLMALALASCATATRGSHTIFKVETVPTGAKVVTDLVYKGNPAKIANAKEGETIYYGCEATPCGIKLPRRSDFNIMILKPGYQPATTAIIKERNNMQAQKSEVAGAGVMATGVVLGGAAAASAAEASLISQFFFPPAAVGASVVIMAIPIAGAVTGVDLATGALIDLRPNPLQLELKPEASEKETEELIAAFLNTRRIHNEAP